MNVDLDAVWLEQGAHTQNDGGCLMEWTALFAGLAKTDRPKCTNPVITRVAQQINDRMHSTDRQRLKVFIPRLAAAKRSSQDQRVNVRLAVWAARRVMHLVSDLARSAAEAAITAAEGWLDGTVTAEECRRAAAAGLDAAYAADAAAGLDAAHAAGHAAYAAAYAADAAAYAAAYDTAYAADAAYDAAYDTYDAYAAARAAAHAAAHAADVFIAFLDELLDAHQKALAEEGVLWEPDFCAFADEMAATQ